MSDLWEGDQCPNSAKHIKALIEQHTAQRRRESDREAAVRRRGKLLHAEQKSPSKPMCRCTSAASA